MNSDYLKKRTKKFALRILKLAAALPDTIEGKTIRVSLVGPAHQSVQTIEPPAGGALEQSSLQKLARSKRNRTKAPFGWE